MWFPGNGTWQPIPFPPPPAAYNFANADYSSQQTPLSHDDDNSNTVEYNALAPNYSHPFGSVQASPTSTPTTPGILFNSTSPTGSDALTMPATPLSKIGLDARAAELKEKLLKGRSQNRPSPAQSPAPASAPTPAPIPPSAAATPARPLSERAKPPGLTPLATPGPGPRPTASLPADADDIAALISSISGSSSVGEIADQNVGNAPSKDPQQTTPARRTEPAAERPPLPQMPTPKLSIPNAPQSPSQARQPNQSSRGPLPATELSKQKQPQSAVESPEEGELTSTPQKNLPAATPRTTKVTAKAATASPVGKAPPASATTKTPVATAPAKAPSAPATPKIPQGPTPKAPERKAPVATTAPSTNGPKATASDPNSRRESFREITGPAPPTQPPPRKLSSSSGNNSEARTLAATTPRTNPASVGATTAGAGAGAGQDAAIKKEPGLSEPHTTEDALNRLLSQVPDLKDFLEMTDYFDVEVRTKKLDRFRRAKALAAEKLRIEEEERKLMEEEELDMGIHRSTVARFTGALSGAAAGSETTNSALTTPATPTPIAFPPTPTAAAAVPPEAPKAAQPNLAKRALDEEAPEPRPKVPRLDAPPPPRSAGGDSKPKADVLRERDVRGSYDSRDGRDGRDGRDARDLSPHRRPYPPSSPRYEERYRRSPPPRPRTRSDYDDYDHRPKYDSYRKPSPERYRDSGPGYHVSYPIRVDLGRKGDSRFFIVKSFNEENVRRCMDDGIWTTQVQNGQILSDAYATCRNVILFFSINKSRAFQGYARMSSPPSPTIPRPSFVKGIHWDTSDPFRVQWLSKTSVEFFRVGHLKNPLNEGAPVLVGKDGQEIEGECGAELLREMEGFAAAAASAEKGGRGWERRESGGGGGGGFGGKVPGGGYYGKRYIKSEDTR